MKSKIPVLLILTLTASLFLGCPENDDNDQNLSFAPVLSIDAPSTGSINQKTVIEVSFLVNNGCGSFKRFLGNQKGKTTDIEVQAHYVDQICTQATQTLKANYEFTPTETGSYTYKFKASNDEVITTIIDVN